MLCHLQNWIVAQNHRSYSSPMDAHPKIQLARLRDIGWDIWDPIGLNQIVAPWKDSGADDEYDSYLLQVVSRQTRGQTDEEVADYLIDIEANWMGLGDTVGNRERALEVAAAVRVYLGTL